MVEGKLRLLSQCSAAFLAAIDAAISSITTAAFLIRQEVFGSGPAIIVSATTGNNLGILGVKPHGTGGEADLMAFDAPDQDNAGYADVNTSGGIATFGAFHSGTGTTQTEIRLEVEGTKIKLTSAGVTTLPGIIVNTAKADVAAAAGQMWLSSTNADNIKYSSATTLYTLKSTKGAVANATAAAPTATASTTSVMMACGGAITPLNTGRVLITISGQMANGTINDGATVDLRYGTGTAPNNGDAVSGTLVGIAQTQTSLVGAAKSGFCISGIVSGLTLGTAIWIDASLKAVTGGSASITGVSISVSEV